MLFPLLRKALWAIFPIALLFMAAQPGMATSPCEQESYASTDFLVCTIDPADADLRLFWQEDEGAPFRSFSAVARALEAQGERLVFGLNAGMYWSDFTPMGLYVEAGKTLRPANREQLDDASGAVPNFYKRPNGIFFVTPSGAGILPTDRYLDDEPEALIATQSGPMLVIDGALNPILIEGSTERRPRSGVGICAGGLVRFAISERPVNFFDLGRLFQDRLGCQDALYLDGGRGTGLYDPERGRNDFSWHGGFGPMFGLVEPLSEDR